MTDVAASATVLRMDGEEVVAGCAIGFIVASVIISIATSVAVVWLIIAGIQYLNNH